MNEQQAESGGVAGTTIREDHVVTGLFRTRGRRVSQLLDLCLLAPELQEAILGLEAADGAEPMARGALREVVRAEHWGDRGPCGLRCVF